MMKRTISGMVGKGSISHNNREFFADNIDRNRTVDNITYCHANLKEIYAELFGEALKRYNEKQTRNDRKIPDYYEHIRTGKQEKLFHEVILQIGNCKDTGVGSNAAKLAVQALDDYMQQFGERNPNLRIFGAYLHMDEETPHLHIDFVPFTTGSKRGLETRVSLKKALETQGFQGGTREETEVSAWINAEKKILATVMERHGLEWEQLGTNKEHLSVLDYKKQERTKEVKTLEKKIDTLNQKQMGITSINNITTNKIPMTTKVMIEQEDFDMLTLAAKKYIAQDQKERKLSKLLESAYKTIENLKATITSLRKELDSYKSIKTKLKSAQITQENQELRKENATYLSILRGHGLTHLLEKNRNRGMDNTRL